MDNLTDITIVLDRSGSMQSTKSDAIGGFNTLVQDQRKVPGEALLSLVQFDNHYEPAYEAKPIKEASLLDDGTYQPRGSTALYDAIGRTIDATGARLSKMPEHERPSKVVFVIITDGDENASREFNAAKIAEMISHQRDTYKWEFVFMGSNQDAITSAAKLSIPTTNSLTYQASAQGTCDSYGALSANLKSLRSGASVSMSFSTDQRKRQEDLLKKES